MDSKSIIIAILVVLIAILGIGIYMSTNDQTTTNTTNTTNETNTTNVTNDTNGSGNVTPTPTPAPVKNNTTGKYIGSSKAISIVKSAMSGKTGFSASLSSYGGQPAYRVTYYHSGEDVPEWEVSYVNAYTGKILSSGPAS